MNRIVIGCSFALATLLASAPAALGHGGTFTGPGGAVPPDLRTPTDPPPPPPPPTTEPTGPTPTGPEPHPGPTTPPGGTNPPLPPPVTGDPTGTGPRRTPTIGYENWTFWFGHNRDARWPLDRYPTRVTPDSPLGFVGGASGNRSDATHTTEKEIREVVRPALLWAMDRKNRLNPDVVSAAYLALAKTTDAPGDVDLLEGAVRDADLDVVVRESAALSIGLLRRSEERRRFDAKEYDRARDFCFRAFADDGLPTRTRAFAMFSVGLLGDMPARGGASGETTARGDATSRIFEMLHDAYPQPDMPVALLLALSLQPPTSVTEEMLGVLRDCALRGRMWKQEASALTQSYAALAVGRVGTSAYCASMLNAVGNRATDLNVKRSAAIALGLLGQRVDGAERATLASDLLKLVEAAKDASVKNFGTISLAYLLEADARATRTDVLDARRVSEYLLKVAEGGSAVQRPFGALALGIVGRAIGDRTEIPAYGALRVESIRLLKKGLDDQRMDKRSRAAFATSLGILQDSSSRQRLVAIVADRTEDKELRGYAAVALGLIGEPTPDAVNAIKDAMRERSSDELRLQTAMALGYLAQPDTVEILIGELEQDDTQNVQGQIVTALSRIGDARAIAPLIRILRDGAKPALTRALACAGLGLVGDVEAVSSLCRIRTDVNYRALCDSVAEVLTIL